MVHSVTPLSDTEPRGDMSVVGIIAAVGVALLLLPLLPVVAELWIYEQVANRDRTAGRRERTDWQAEL